MPTYQYKREDGTMFEILQKISDKPLKICPETGQKVKRIITGGSGVVYKGSGWYVTDYKNKSGKPSANKQTKSDAPESNGTTGHSHSNGHSGSGDINAKNGDSNVPSEKK